MKLVKTNKKNKTQATIIVKQIVAKVLNIELSAITNNTELNYFDAMAATYDLHHAYPHVLFPEDKFDKYCRVGTLRNYVCARLKTKSK